MENKEKYIIDTIRDHREAVNTEDLWASISGSIPQEDRKKRPVFWWWTSTGAVALLLMGWFILADSPSTPENHIESIQNSLQKNDGQSSTIATLKRIDDNEDVEVSDPKDTSPETSSQSIKSYSDNIQITDIQNSQVRNVIESQILNEEVNSSSFATNTISKKVNLVPEIAEDKEKLKESDLKNQALGSVLVGASSNVKLASQMFSFPVISQRNANHQFQHIDPLLEISPYHSITPFNSNNNNGWIVRVSSGVSVLKRNLTSKIPDTPQELSRRDAIESELFGIHFTGLIGYRWKDWRISSGLGFNRVYEKSQYEAKYIIEDSEPSGTTYYQDGTTASSGSPLLLEQHVLEKRYNRLTYIDIPLQVEYRMFSLRNIDIYAGANISYALHQEYSGFTGIDLAGSPYDLLKDPEVKFNRSGNKSFGGSLAMEFNVSSGLSGRMGMTYRRLSNISSEIYLIDQQYNLFTISAGMIQSF